MVPPLTVPMTWISPWARSTDPLLVSDCKRNAPPPLTIIVPLLTSPSLNVASPFVPALVIRPSLSTSVPPDTTRSLDAIVAPFATISVPPTSTAPLPSRTDPAPSVTLLKSTVPELFSVIVSPLIVAFDKLGELAVPPGITTVSPLVGTTPPDQFDAVFQSLLTAPVHVSPEPPPLVTVTGTVSVVSTPA